MSLAMTRPSEMRHVPLHDLRWNEADVADFDAVRAAILGRQFT